MRHQDVLRTESGGQVSYSQRGGRFVNYFYNPVLLLLLSLLLSLLLLSSLF